MCVCVWGGATDLGVRARHRRGGGRRAASHAAERPDPQHRRQRATPVPNAHFVSSLFFLISTLHSPLFTPFSPHFVGRRSVLVSRSRQAPHTKLTSDRPRATGGGAKRGAAIDRWEQRALRGLRRTDDEWWGLQIPHLVRQQGQCIPPLHHLAAAYFPRFCAARVEASSPANSALSHPALQSPDNTLGTVRPCPVLHSTRWSATTSHSMPGGSGPTSQLSGGMASEVWSLTTPYQTPHTWASSAAAMSTCSKETRLSTLATKARPCTSLHELALALALA